MKKIIFILFLFVIFLLSSQKCFAFWMWTPETNEWVNPKYAVKETPAEQLKFSLDFYQSKKYDEAVREFKKLIKYYPRAREAPEAQFYIGQCLEDQGKVYEAFKQYQLVIDTYPFSERSAVVVEKQYDIGVGLLEGHGEKHNKFIEAFAGTDYNVVDIFRAVIKNAPYGKLAAVSQYKIGLYLLEKKMYQEARDEFEKTMNDYPESSWSKAAKYQIAVADTKRSTSAQYDQKVTKAAVKEFKEFLIENPDAELSQAAKNQVQQLREKEAENNFVIAQFYEKQKKYQAAKLYYQTILDEYGLSSWAPKALDKLRELSVKIQ